MKSLLLALLLCSLAVAQDNSKLNIKYDRIADRTNISTKPIYLKKSGLTMLAYFNHQGLKLKEPVKQVGIVFYSHSEEWQFLRGGDRSLLVLADGERFSPVGPNRQADAERDGTVSEQLLFQLSVEQLDSMIKAKQVEFKLGQQTFTLGNDAIEGLRQLRLAMNP